jgi:hypothetical protein
VVDAKIRSGFPFEDHPFLIFRCVMDETRSNSFMVRNQSTAARNNLKRFKGIACLDSYKFATYC